MSNNITKAGFSATTTLGPDGSKSTAAGMSHTGALAG